MQSVTTMFRGAVFAAGLTCASLAHAEPIDASAPGGQVSAFADVDVISAEDLGDIAGGTGVDTAVITEQTLVALNQGNKIIADTVGSGEIAIHADAFSGFAGIGNFVINTGHNNNLQSSMNVSIVLAP